MYALSVQKLPQGQEWLYEIKLDGYRALAGKGSRGVNIWSRRGTSLQLNFHTSPEPVKDFNTTH
jgi:bifunctional non-homologous end joining protein LigD